MTNVFVDISYDLLNMFVPMSCVLLIYPGLHASTPFLRTPICPYYAPPHNIRQINPNAYEQNDFATKQVFAFIFNIRKKINICIDVWNFNLLTLSWEDSWFLWEWVVERQPGRKSSIISSVDFFLNIFRRFLSLKAGFPLTRSSNRSPKNNWTTFTVSWSGLLSSNGLWVKS